MRPNDLRARSNTMPRIVKNIVAALHRERDDQAELRYSRGIAPRRAPKRSAR